MSPPRTLAAMIPTIAGKALGKRGLAYAGLLTEWASIVGPRFAERTAPHRLAFPPGQREGATLHLRVAGAFALELQHMEPQLLERINGFFGYKAVARIKLVQAPVLRPPTRKEPLRPLAPAEIQAVDAAAAVVSDEGVAAALARLGKAIIARV